VKRAWAVPLTAQVSVISPNHIPANSSSLSQKKQWSYSGPNLKKPVPSTGVCATAARSFLCSEPVAKNVAVAGRGFAHTAERSQKVKPRKSPPPGFRLRAAGFSTADTAAARLIAEGRRHCRGSKRPAARIMK
jgi:hypothetical protein